MKAVKLGEGLRFDFGERYGVDVQGVEIEWLIYGPAMALRYFRVQPGVHIPEHSHPWEHVIIVRKGGMKVRVKDEEVEVRELDHIHVPSNVPHEYWVSGDGCEFYCIINCMGENCVP